MRKNNFNDNLHHGMNARLWYEIGSVVLRFYEQIITGIWAILIMIPVDEYLNIKFSKNHEEVNISNYLIYLGFYTLFFLASAASVPYFKKLIMRTELFSLAKENYITLKQMIRIRRILEGGLVFKSFFTREGFLQFLMSNLFGLGVIAAYFGTECLIEIFIGISDSSYWVGIVFILIFFFILFLESVLDKIVARRMRSDPVKYRNIEGYSTGRKMLYTVIRMFSGLSLSTQVYEKVVNDAIDDVYDVFDISSTHDSFLRRHKQEGAKRGDKKKVSIKKTNILQKIKKISSVKKKKIVKKSKPVR